MSPRRKHTEEPLPRRPAAASPPPGHSAESAARQTLVFDDNATASELYGDGDTHANALRYYQSDNTFTLSDRDLDGFVKMTREGELIWQLGGDAPKGDSFSLVGIDPW